MDVGHMLSVNTLNNRIASWNTNELGEREGGGRAEGVCPTKEGGRRPTTQRTQRRSFFLFVCFPFCFSASYSLVHGGVLGSSSPIRFECRVLAAFARPLHPADATKSFSPGTDTLLLPPRSGPAHPPHALPFLVSRFSFLETYRQGAPPSSSNKKVIFLFFL